MKFILLLSLFLGACSHGFNAVKMREESLPPMQITDDSVKDAFKRKPQLPKPFRVGVYFKEPRVNRSERGHAWRWTEKDKDSFFALAETICDTGEVADIFPILPEIPGTDELRSLRLAAAQHGADALLVINGAEEVDQTANGWSATYLLVLPMLFAPGNDVEALFTARATLWDVRNEALYLSAEAESLQKSRAPLVRLDVKSTVDKAKEEALLKLRGTLLKRFLALLRTGEKQKLSATGESKSKNL